MASIKKQIRTNQVLDVIKLSSDGISIVEACREVGIARSTFYLFCDSNPDVIADFQELERFHAREQYVTILMNKTKMIECLCEDAVSIDTPPMKRLRIIQHMDKRLDELESKFQSRSPSDSRAEMREILTGPELIPGKSRFHHTDDRSGISDMVNRAEGDIPIDKEDTEKGE